MDTRHMYEQIMLEYCYNKMKYLRNQWNGDASRQSVEVTPLIDIGGSDHRQYYYIMQGCENIVFEMLADIIKGLLKEYGITVKYYDLRSSVVDAYYVGNEKQWQDYIDQHDEREILAFSRTDKYTDVLYIFKKYGIGKRIPQKTLKELMAVAQLTKSCYISYVDGNAYSEVLNHNDNEKDPTRGTGIFSFRQFIEGLFGKDEYSVFQQYANQFTEKVKDYFGFSLVRTLKPNSILNFKKYVRDEITRINADAIGVTAGIEVAQREIIENHFFQEKNYEILLGSSDFAKSYMTAEWLFYSLSNAGNVDLTAIAMGYFKSIEQLLFRFLSLHTYESDSIMRKVFVGSGKAFADIYGYAELTDALVTDREKAKYITLGSMTNFFGYHDHSTGRWYKRNQDLLADGINDQTYEFIVDSFGSISDFRNGYFHKDNLEEWSEVKAARKTAQLLFYLLLGSYKISDTEKTRLGIIQVDNHDDFYKLCDYINKKSYERMPLNIPIFYFNGNEASDPYSFFGYAYHDDYIEYDNYGEPIFSGAFFQQFGDKPAIMKVGKDHMPEEIWEGSLVISQSVPISIEPSGPQIHVFSHGRFLLTEGQASTPADLSSLHISSKIHPQ